MPNVYLKLSAIKLESGSKTAVVETYKCDYYNDVANCLSASVLLGDCTLDVMKFLHCVNTTKKLPTPHFHFRIQTNKNRQCRPWPIPTTEHLVALA